MTAVKRTHLSSLAVAALVGGFVLSGCQQDPGVAARVGDATISASDVDLLSNAMCEEREDLAKQGQQAAAPRAVARDEALLSLIRVEIGDAYAKAHPLTIDNAGVNSMSSKVATDITSIDDADRPRLRGLIRSLLVDQQRMMSIAQAAYKAAGQQAPTDAGTLIEAGRKQMMTDTSLPKVEVNPRFDSPRFADVGVANADVSKVVSKKAEEANSVAGSAVTSLPANLRCG